MRFFALFLMFSAAMVPVTLGQPVHITLESVSAELDQTVTLHVQAVDGVVVGNLAYTIRYNPTALTLQGVSEITTLPPTTLLATNPSQFPDGSGLLHLDQIFATGLPPSAPIAALTFIVRDTTDLMLTFDALTAYTTNGAPLAVVGEAGSIGMVPTTTDASTLPEQFVLHPNYPNPFNPTTTLAYDLPQATALRLEVFDILGRRVAVLLDEVQAAGHHQVQWDASRMASGVYFARMVTHGAPQQMQVQKMMLIK